MGKCPKCSRKFAATKAGYKDYVKHYYEAHVPENQKARNKKKNFVYKAPGFTKLMKKKRR